MKTESTLFAVESGLNKLRQTRELLSLLLERMELEQYPDDDEPEEFAARRYLRRAPMFCNLCAVSLGLLDDLDEDFSELLDNLPEPPRLTVIQPVAEQTEQTPCAC